MNNYVIKFISCSPLPIKPLNWVQATEASLSSKKLLHTVPHALLMHSSTLPSLVNVVELSVDEESLILPVVQLLPSLVLASSSEIEKNNVISN